MAPRQEITRVEEPHTFWNETKNSDFNTHAYPLSRRPTFPLAPTSFDNRLVEDRKGKCHSFFFSPPSLYHALHISFSFFSSFYFSFLFFFFFPFLFYFSFFSSLILFIFFSPYSPIFFYFLQVRGSFFSLYYSSCHVSPFLWSMCHMDTCSRWHSPNHMALMPCVLLPCCHVAAPGHAMCHNTMCHLTLGASKNVKFRPSRNLMVKSVSSYEI